MAETCEHGGYDRNCTRCIIRDQEARGVRDERGVNHADNGAGWCVGHIEGERCTVLVRHCPVLNTPEQVAQNRREDHALAVTTAEARVARARSALAEAEQALADVGSADQYAEATR